MYYFQERCVPAAVCTSNVFVASRLRNNRYGADWSVAFLRIGGSARENNNDAS